MASELHIHPVGRTAVVEKTAKWVEDKICWKLFAVFAELARGIYTFLTKASTSRLQHKITTAPTDNLSHP